MKRGLFLLTVLGMFAACTQEHLIFVKNINRAKLITLDQVIKESGLSRARSVPVKLTQESNQVSATVRTTAVNPPVETQKKKVPSLNKQIEIPQGQDFSINLAGSGGFILVKSIQGDVKYLKDKTKQDSGIFLFHSGSQDSKIHMQTYDLGGNLEKNIYYYVKVEGSQSSPAPINQKEPKTEPSRQQTTETKKTESAQAEQNDANTALVDANLSEQIIRSTKGLSTTDAARELQKMIDGGELTASDQEKVRYQLIDLLLKLGSYEAARNNIALLSNPGKKSLYNARYQKARRHEKEALKNYIDALSGDQSTTKAALIELEKLVISMGSVQKDLLDRLIGETKRQKADKELYAASMLNIARIYQYLPDIYAAQEVLESLINGDFDPGIKDRAKQAYDELKRDFLDYK